MEVAIQIFEGLQTTTYIKFDLLKSQSWVTYYIDCICTWEALNMWQMHTKNTSANSESIKFHSPMVKEKRNSQLIQNLQPISANFCGFYCHIENNTTTMQHNRSVHTAWFHGSSSRVGIILFWQIIFSLNVSTLSFWNLFLKKNFLPSVKCALDFSGKFLL